ncbi:hypothetical protein TDB9533_03786 [Thalassocella blandensis]|nr:hypothetical protein TDB9533_03786 [Thalassocella blandensis]
MNNVFKYFILYVLGVFSLGASAQTMFIKHGNLNIPISNQSVPTGPNICSHLHATKRNIIYMDDLGSYPVMDNRANGGDDPNGLQDLAIVLGFNALYSNQIKLLGVGTTNRRSDAPAIARRIVSAAQQSVPVWSESEIVAKIKAYARCPASANNKLGIAVGGEWNKVAKAIAEAEAESQSNSNKISIKNRIEVVGLGASNRRDLSTPACNPRNLSYYDGNPWKAWNDVRTAIGSSAYTFDERTNPVCRGTTSTVETFRGAYKFAENNATRNEYNAFYNNHFKRVLRGVRDGRDVEITENNGDYDLALLSHNKDSGKALLRFADYLAVAKFIWPNTSSATLQNPDFIHPKIKSALGKLR